MIFGERSLDKIADDEIASLVEAHVCERQHLEFKATFEYQDDTARLELLRDVVSMANGGGGYLVLGIRDDGHGRAQAFVEPALMSRSASMIKAIRSLCHAHIAERIEGIEVRSRCVGGRTVIIVRIPVSGRRPHMVTLGHRTDFVIRVEDGKREMSLGEIREALVSTPMGMRLDRIDARISDLARTMARREGKRALITSSEASVSDALIRSSDGALLAEVMRERFENEVGKSPFLWLGVTPATPRRNLIAVDDPDVVHTLSNPPGSRPHGWSMAGLDHDRRVSVTGVQLGTKHYKYLEVLENGHLEFWAPLGENFCWRQSPEERRVRPRLYPYPVVEYPVSFLRLASALLGGAEYYEGVLIQLEYRNVAGHILRPGRPEQFDFDSPLVPSIPFTNSHLHLGPIHVADRLEPNAAAFELLKSMYRAFGLEADRIPFRDSDGTFSFGS